MNGVAVSVCKIECNSGFVVSLFRLGDNMCPLSCCKAGAGISVEVRKGNVGADDKFESFKMEKKKKTLRQKL